MSLKRPTSPVHRAPQRNNHMGFFDRFKSSKERIGKDKKPKHIVEKPKSGKQRSEEEKRRQFAAVPSAGAPAVSRESGETKKASKDGAKSPAAPKTLRRKENSGIAYRVLHRALVSEKSTAMTARNQYAFVVAPGVNKVDVGRAIQSLYGVRPLKVNIMNVRGKRVRYGRTEGATKDWKKAVVTLMPGQKLDVAGT